MQLEFWIVTQIKPASASREVCKETVPGFVNGNSCFVAFTPATQPLKQTAQTEAGLDRKSYSQNLGRFL